MPTSIRFYRDTLGFTLASTSPALGGEDRFHWCMLRLGDAMVMLNTAYEFDSERPVPPDQTRQAAHGDTCLYFDCPDVDRAFQQLRDQLPSIKAPTTAPYGMKQLYLHDPDGYNLCLQWPAKQ
jgi:uncharacterized glyoxalase superfamily protein PhnB